MKQRGGRGGGQRRPSKPSKAWGGHYASKRQHRNNRHAALDSSVAVAINSGPQPTLAKRRRQLANNKWEATATKDFDVDKIFQDLLESHTKHHNSIQTSNFLIGSKLTANTMVMNSRKSFWKRKLSGLSTKDFDAIWKLARNRFLWQVNHQNDKETAGKSKEPSESTTEAPGKKRPPPVGASDPESKSGPAAAAAGASASANKSKAAIDNDNDVIDLCDSDSDSEVEIVNRILNGKDFEEGEGGDSNNAGDNAPKTDAEIKTRSSPIDATKMIVDRSSKKKNPDKNIGEDNVVGEKPSARYAPQTAAPANASPSPDKAIVATPNTKTNQQQSSSNRWSKLFLGPDFRTEHVFTLDEGDELF
jgi:hypothetical protein